MITSFGLICIAFFLVLINPFGWHMIIHIAPLYLPFILKNIGRLNFLSPKPVLCMFLFFIYTLLSILLISNNAGAFGKIIRYLYELILISIFFNTIIPLYKLSLLIKFYTLSCVAVVLKMAFQRVVLPEDETRYTIFNFIKLMDPNFLTGLFILPSVVLFYRIIHYKKTTDVFVFCLFVCSILATGSRGGLLAVLLGCGIILMRNASFKWKVINLSFGSMALCLLSYLSVDNLNRFSREGLNDGSNDLRFHLWSVSWDIFMSNPIFGRGANSMVNLGIEYGARINLIIHNSFLEILTDYGIIGFLLWINVFLSVFNRSLKKNNILVVSILLSTFFCAFFISAQDSAFWWQNLIICNAMLHYTPCEVVCFNYNLSFRKV